jgi:DNA topoisomerase I
LKLIYEGQKISVNRECEEVCHYWAQQSLKPDWKSSKGKHYAVVLENFKKEFFTRYDGETKIEDFEKLDFSEFLVRIDADRAMRKARSKEEKNREKAEKQKKVEQYGSALIVLPNPNVVEIPAEGGEPPAKKILHLVEKISGGGMIEPPGLFAGRGEHPRAGMMKPRILPE